MSTVCKKRRAQTLEMDEVLMSRTLSESAEEYLNYLEVDEVSFSTWLLGRQRKLIKPQTNQPRFPNLKCRI